MRVPRFNRLVLLAPVLAACTVTHKEFDPTYELSRAKVMPGLAVLLQDSIGLIRGKRVGVIANQTSIDERRRSIVDLLATDSRARAAGETLAAVFAPEHGFRGTEDRTDLPDYVDPKTGVRIYSLYRAATTAPPDSVVRQLDAIVFDLQDVGTRTWTYVGAMVYAMRSAARHGKPFIVLDRPNPLTGFYSEGPMLDSALANADTAMPGRPARAYALHPMPLRHGLTMGEMALYYNQELSIGADLHVVPMKGWSRDVWFDRTDLPWVKPLLELVREAVRKDVPALGHCLGGQLMSKALGGEVTRTRVKEIGWGEVEVADNSVAREWFAPLTAFESFHWHGETFSIPPGATRVLGNEHCANQAFATGRHLGLQCHVEMTEDLVRLWCRGGADEIRASAASPGVQAPAKIEKNLEARIASLHAVADRIYDRWTEGLSRGS